MTTTWPSHDRWSPAESAAISAGIEIADAMDLDDYTQQLWGQAAVAGALWFPLDMLTYPAW